MSGELIHYRGGRVFTADDSAPWAQSLLVRDGLIEFAGSDADADARADGARVVDLGGACVVPGIVEAHCHLASFGASLSQVDLLDAPDLAEMQRRIAVAAEEPGTSPILGRSWLLSPLGGADPHRDMIDAVVADRSVYLTSNDFHSGWVNSAALREMGVDDDTPDPEGGVIVRDEHGVATGLLLETAALVLMRDQIERLTDDAARDAALQLALTSYLESGVTAAVDLGLRDAELDTLERAWLAGTLAIPVAGHIRIETSTSADALAEQLQYAIDARDRIADEAVSRGETDPWLHIAGIKIWVDGVIDSGTAAMHRPFADGTRPEPLWDAERLRNVVVAADAAGLQVALHAIGDAAIDLALDAIEAARATNGDSGIAHRIEHLEVVDPASVARIVDLGVIVSMQPVHCDPVIQEEWRRRLGDDRVDRGYPWTDFADAGATLILGTDAPTAPHRPLPNLYIAATRRSPGHPALPANHPELRLPLESALVAATRDAAAASGWTGTRGMLREGCRADFVVLDRDPFAEGVEVLADATPARVVLGGVEH